jgi:hypothetical protein
MPPVVATAAVRVTFWLLEPRQALVVVLVAARRPGGRDADQGHGQEAARDDREPAHSFAP